jgi:hypothetical protein
MHLMKPLQRIQKGFKKNNLALYYLRNIIRISFHKRLSLHYALFFVSTPEHLPDFTHYSF